MLFLSISRVAGQCIILYLIMIIYIHILPKYDTGNDTENVFRADVYWSRIINVQIESINIHDIITTTSVLHFFSIRKLF